MCAIRMIPCTGGGGKGWMAPICACDDGLYNVEKGAEGMNEGNTSHELNWEEKVSAKTKSECNLVLQ